MPRASARPFIELAVPMVLQWPAEGAEAATICMNSSYSISPSASSLRACQTTVPEPASLPLNQPSSIGPPESTMAGMFTVAAPIRQAGVVLSQPVVSTTPSSG